MQNSTFDIKKNQTVACKLEVSPEAALEIDATLKVLALASNYIHKNVDANAIANSGIRVRIFQAVREEFNLPPNLVLGAIAIVAEARQMAYMTESFVKEFKPNSAEFNSTIFSFREQDLTMALSLLRGEQRFKVLIGKHQLDLLKGQQLKSATLVKRHNFCYYIHFHWETIWIPAVSRRDREGYSNRYG
ncbi:MAG TPA: hypothetical protein VK211_02445 [Kamptonema sp.]|nr:hypothetical protein [Kamptonema sp.]